MLAAFHQAKKGGRVGRKGKLRQELHIRHTNRTFHHIHVSDKIKVVAGWLLLFLHPESMTRETYLGIGFAARYHHPETHGQPETSHKFDDANSQDQSSKSHFGII